MFVAVLGVLILLSIALSFWSLRNLNTKKEVDDVKKRLKKSRVVFQRPDSSSAE